MSLRGKIRGWLRDRCNLDVECLRDIDAEWNRLIESNDREDKKRHDNRKVLMVSGNQKGFASSEDLRRASHILHKKSFRTVLIHRVELIIEHSYSMNKYDKPKGYDRSVKKDFLDQWYAFCEREGHHPFEDESL